MKEKQTLTGFVIIGVVIGVGLAAINRTIAIKASQIDRTISGLPLELRKVLIGG